MSSVPFLPVRKPSALSRNRISVESLTKFSHFAKNARSPLRVAAGQEKDFVMAKGYKRGNREVRKPKQVKSVPIVVPMFEKGALATAAMSKKKKL